MTTPTTQPDDRCEQIARDLLQTWKNGHLLSESDFQREGRLLRVIKSALQAAKQRGREEERKLDTICHAVKAEQQPKSDPSRECGDIAYEIITTFSSADPSERIIVLHKLIAAALQSKQDEMDALRDKLKALQPTSPQPQTPHQ